MSTPSEQTTETMNASVPRTRPSARGWHLTPLRRALLAAVVVGLPALALYWRTLMPDVGYWDTAEFQAIGPVLGIAHPTGYPTYTLLAWFASVVLQPFGNEALRANLISALLVAGACAVIGALLAYLTRRLVIGIGIGLVFAACTRAWSVGLHADPHALHLFLVSVLLAVLVVWADRQRAGKPADRLLIASAVLFGVALGNHALTLLLAPGIALLVLIVYPRIVLNFRLLGACVLALAVTTIALYAYLPMRAAMDPPLNYADPQTWDAFKYVVFGQQFVGTFHDRPTIDESIRLVISESWTQLGVLLPLAALGTVIGFLRRPWLVAMLLAWSVLGWWFALGYDNADIGRYYLVPLLSVAVLGGLGAGGLLESAKVVVERLARARRRLARWAIAAVALAVLIGPVLITVPHRFNSIDESGDHSARMWLTSLGAALPPDAVIVSWWSYSTPMWYAQFVEDWRPDVTIIDDRTMLDKHLGSAQDVLDSYLGQRPLYLLRVPGDLPRYEQRYVLVPVPGIDGQTVYEVTGYQPGALVGPAANL